MTSGHAAAFVAQLGEEPNEEARLAAGLPKLEALFRDLIRAAVPANPQFERERIIAHLALPRETVFILGLLSEGENEAALLLDLAAAVTRGDPAAPTAHLIDEAWYYLRTSIDEQWQIDDGEPSASAALAYLFAILTERLDVLRCGPRTEPLAAHVQRGRAELLRALRAALSEPSRAAVPHR